MRWQPNQLKMKRRKKRGGKYYLDVIYNVENCRELFALLYFPFRCYYSSWNWFILDATWNRFKCRFSFPFFPIQTKFSCWTIFVMINFISLFRNLFEWLAIIGWDEISTFFFPSLLRQIKKKKPRKKKMKIKVAVERIKYAQIIIIVQTVLFVSSDFNMHYWYSQ